MSTGLVALAIVLTVAFVWGCGSSSSPTSRERKAEVKKFCDSRKVERDQGGSVAPELAMNRSQFAPGEAAFVRVFNFGSTYLEFGLNPTAEVKRRGHWVKLSIGKNGVPQVRSSVNWLLPPHQGSECAEIPVSPDWAAGSYRATLKVEAHSKSGGTRVVRLAVPFHVTS
jgi:hypothetical protein